MFNIFYLMKLNISGQTKNIYLRTFFRNKNLFMKNKINKTPYTNRLVSQVIIKN